MKKVLVLMASYNGENYIEEQIESLLSQEEVEVSILVRDDGSKDNTWNILKNYETAGKLKCYTGEHLNVEKGFFDLMGNAVYYDVDYYAFCDQDDVWDIDKLKIATEYLEGAERTKPAMYYCGQRLVDAERNFIEDHCLNENRSLTTRFVLSDVAGCTAVFNKALLRKVLQYKPKYMLMHDTWVLKVCLAVGGNVFVDSRPHMDYRQHGKNSVGLGHSWKAQLKQVKQYINQYHVEAQMLELKKGFYNEMVPAYKYLTDCICEYRTNRKYKKKLLDKTYINFCNKGLNLTYWIKVRLNKL